jgi:hypothetical protein
VLILNAVGAKAIFGQSESLPDECFALTIFGTVFDRLMIGRGTIDPFLQNHQGSESPQESGFLQTSSKPPSLNTALSHDARASD